MLTQFNHLHPNLVFTMEQEESRMINFLDLTISRSNNELSTSVFCKPTATDTLIHYDSRHPYEHKVAGVYYLENRIITYPMSENK
jgi:hypothetical protein